MFFSAPIPKLMTSELFRQGPRTLAMAAAGVSYWLSWFIVVMVLMLLKVEQLFTHYVEIRKCRTRREMKIKILLLQRTLFFHFVIIVDYLHYLKLKYYQLPKLNLIFTLHKKIQSDSNSLTNAYVMFSFIPCFCLSYCLIVLLLLYFLYIFLFLVCDFVYF